MAGPVNPSTIEQSAAGLQPKGALVLVVGPSEAGKDSMIGFARSRLEGHPRYAFARRLITRTGTDASEDHEACTLDFFEAERAAGRLALSWRAHHSAYGIRTSSLHGLELGSVVVASVSRGVIAAGLGLAEHAMVVQITASPSVLAQRLHRRGRETPEEIAARLAREASFPMYEAPLVTICNDGPIERAGNAFVAVLQNLGQGSNDRNTGDDMKPRA